MFASDLEQISNQEPSRIEVLDDLPIEDNYAEDSSPEDRDLDGAWRRH